MDTIISFAIKEEMFGIDMPNVRVITTGVGKANAAYRLCKAVATRKPSLVINIGTAGARGFDVGDIIASTKFIDRDLMPLSINGVVSEIETSCGVSLPSIVTGQQTSLPNVIVSTGDDFVTGETEFTGSIVDMEAFALATVCHNENIPFVAVKYITDIIGMNSIEHWNSKLAGARSGLAAYFNTHIKPILY